MIKNILKVILVLALFVLIFYIVSIANKIIIISRYSKKVDEYQHATNFYAKFEDEYGTRELWRKDDVGITKDTSDNSGMTIVYVKGDELWNISDVKYEGGNSSKTAYKSKIDTEEDETAFMPVIESGTFYVEDNLWEKIKTAFTVKITTTTVNDKKCYEFYVNNDFQIFVNMNDFMKVKEINSGTTTSLVEYNFNSVTDEDVKMPNLEGYEIVEN